LSAKTTLSVENCCVNSFVVASAGDGCLTSLDDLGFIKGTIAETIVSTYVSQKKPNAAPMGVVATSDNQLRIRPFCSSLTYKNLQTAKCAVVNVTVNPELFYLTAFKEANPYQKLSPDLFEEAETVQAPRLRAADAFIEVIVDEVGSFGADRADFLCSAQRIVASKTEPTVYCRAQYATIEAIIHATRIKPFLKGNIEEQKQAIKLLKLVDVCRNVVERTAPNSQYAKIMTDLTQCIEQWKKQT
jgi:hypothetical protein